MGQARLLHFSRHFKRNYSEEVEVSIILAHPKGSRGRRVLFEKLKRKGNFYNNANCFRDNKWKIILVRRPTTEANPSNYLPCRLCFGYFSSNRLYRHLKECKLSQSDVHSKNVQTRNAQTFVATLTMANNDSSIVLKNKVFPEMRNNKITSVKNDKMIGSYGNQLMKTRQDKKLISLPKIEAVGKTSYVLTVQIS